MYLRFHNYKLSFNCLHILAYFSVPWSMSVMTGKCTNLDLFPNLLTNLNLFPNLFHLTAAHNLSAEVQLFKLRQFTLN